MWASKLSLYFLFLGLGLMSLSPNWLCYVLALTVYTLSVPVPDSLRSFSTGQIGNKEEVEKLYLRIGMVETIAGAISTALWSGVFPSVLGKGWLVERSVFLGCLLVLTIAVLFLFCGSWRNLGWESGRKEKRWRGRR
jgi:hypothetical protein